MTWKFFVEQKPWSGALNLRIGRQDLRGLDLVQPFVMKRYEPGHAVPDDEIALAGNMWAAEEDVRGFLQAAADAAWEIGIRPAGAKDQTSELKAVRDHLADMRTLALKPASHPASGEDRG